MALRINTNIAALNAHKNLANTDNQLSNSLSKLSSGLRINKAADDASGMVIADSLKAQQLGLGQAIRNASDGINIVQTADAALGESINIVNVIRTKSIQAAQDGQTTESRRAIQSDISRLMEELDMIANTTSFNNQKLLSGNFTNKKFQVGAYSGETINISIATSQSSKIGHTMTSRLSVNGDKPGAVDISLFSNIQNKNFDVETVELAFDNNRDHGMGAVANSINKLSDLLGISAKAFVTSTTESAIIAGKTDSTFTINGVLIGEIAVLANDANGALSNSINNKTQQHGIVASVDVKGVLTLTSTDGRTIDVTSQNGTSAVLDNTNMSTVGYIQLNQTGANEIIINDTSGGDVISLKESKIEIQQSDPTIAESTVAKGSIIKTNSVLGAGWTTNQVIYGDKFNADITTTQESLLTKGSGLASGSIVAAKGLIAATMVVSGDSTALSSEGMFLTGSKITENSTLGTGSIITAGMTTTGKETIIETTTATVGNNTIASGSTLTAGTVLGSNTNLPSGTSDVTIARTGITAGESVIISGSSLGAGTILSAGTVIYGRATLEQTGSTTSQSKIQEGSILTKGSILGAGTNILDSGQFQLSDRTTGNNTIESGSTLAVGSIIGAGTVIATGLLSGATGYAVGDTVLEDVILTTAVTLADGSETLAANSVIGNGTILISGSVITADLTFAADFTVPATGPFRPETNSSFAAGTTILSAATSGAIIQTDTTLKTSMTISGTITSGAMYLKVGSLLGENTTLKADTTDGIESKIATDITLVSATTLGSEEAMTATAGTLFGNNTVLEGGSAVATDITLSSASVLSGDMATLTGDMTIGAGTVLATGTTIQDGSSLTASFRLGGNVSLTSDMAFDINSVFNAGAFTKFNLGSKIGGDARLASELPIIANMTLGIGSGLQKETTLTNGSTLGSNTIINDDITVASGTQMELARGTQLKAGSIITAGTYLTNDIVTSEGVFKAGNELLKDITTAEDTDLNFPMTVNAGSFIKKGSTLGMNTADSNASTTQVTDPDNNRLGDVNVLTQETAQIAIAVAASALQDLDKVRADLGSIQNQLTSTIANITTTKVNIMASESTIRDVDFAAESSTFTKLQILAQAGTFALSQANASAQHVMSLLQ